MKCCEYGPRRSILWLETGQPVLFTTGTKKDTKSDKHTSLLPTAVKSFIIIALKTFFPLSQFVERNMIKILQQQRHFPEPR
jgi:hypothetical protein